MLFLRPKTLSIITTHHCTAACDHCCFHCTPKITTRIPPDRLESLVAEAAEVPSIKLIAFTGGECFTIPELDARIGQATALGIKTRCVSNGYWAFSPDRAAKRASDFAKAGLTELNLSTGTFHAKYVPIERIVFGARASADAGVRTLITVEAFEGDGDIAEQLRSHPDIKADIDQGNILFQRNVWMENGGTTSLTHSAEFKRFSEERKCGCKTVLDVVAVTPTLSVVACCGLHLEKIPDLHIGSLASSTLGDVISKSDNDFMKIWLHVSGPERILEFAKSKDNTIELPSNSVHPCQTCLVLYQDKKAIAAIASHYKEIESDVVNLYSTGILLETLQHRLNNQVESSEFA